MRLNEENKNYIEELNTKVTEKSKLVEILSNEHDDLDKEFSRKICPQIPKDLMSISI
jgi:hypothetical protein